MKVALAIQRERLAICAAVLLCALVPRGAADPVYGKVFSLKQPDGSPYQVKIWGDEFYRIVESLDGYTLVRDPRTQFGCYARLSADGNELASTGVPVAQAPPQSLGLVPHMRINATAAQAQIRAARARFEAARRQRPPVGAKGAVAGARTAVRGICLLIDFSDDQGTIPPATVADYCNTAGFTGFGNNGSVRDYFYDVSGGQLTYTNFVPSAYYRAKQPKTYYTDPAIPFGDRAQELIIEALQDLDLHGFDFSQYDANGDGVIDALNCFYAGEIQNGWAEGLWPHAWIVDFSADGVSTGWYQMTDMSAELKLSTFCHENGHMLLGWPDLYDYSYRSWGDGRFCIMAYGTTDTNPCQPCAFLKYIAGWCTTTELTTPQTGLPVPSGVNAIYKYPDPLWTTEYYLIENRQKTGRDRELPAEGLALWHIDELGNNSWPFMLPDYHYMVTLVQADGHWDLEHGVNGGDAQDLWAAPDRTKCSPITHPDTHWWDGSNSALLIQDISVSGPVMTFSFAHDCNANGVADSEDIAQGTSPDCNGNSVPDECENVLPEIATQPADTAVCQGQTAVFTVVVNDPSVTGYQWRKGGQAIPGATQSSFTIVAVQPADAGYYDVQVTSPCGTTTSVSARLTVVLTGPRIATGPVGQVQCAGMPVEFTVVPAGEGPLHYQWRKGGQAIPGANERGYEIDAVTFTDAGDYDVVVSNPCDSVTSAVATLAVEDCMAPDPPVCVSPADGAINVSIDTGLDWADSTYAISYDVYFGTVPNPPRAANTTTSACALPRLAYESRYYWRIVSKSRVLTTEGEVWSFTTAPRPIYPPEAPTLPSPADGTADVPLHAVLDWNDVPDAALYLVSVGTSPEPPFQFQGATAASEWTIYSLAPGTKYYWKVTAQNKTGSRTGPIWTFTTAAPDAPPPPPVQTNQPPSGEIASGGTPPESGASDRPPTETPPTEPPADLNALVGPGLCPAAAAVVLSLTVVGLWSVGKSRRRHPVHGA